MKCTKCESYSRCMSLPSLHISHKDFCLSYPCKNDADVQDYCSDEDGGTCFSCPLTLRIKYLVMQCPI